jgi:pyruvate-formate lyase-activating enzyme
MESSSDARGDAATDSASDAIQRDSDELLRSVLGNSPMFAGPRRQATRVTTRRTLTRRAVVWLGQTCNLKCDFCYFKDRIADRGHPEHAFMSLEKAKKICRTVREVYGNNAIDIQGGEPTIFPQIAELVRYCRDIGLVPTLITNALVLAREDRCQSLIDAGLRDFLVSVQGIGSVHDHVVGVPGAFAKVVRALENMMNLKIPFRFNCVMSKLAVPQLPALARLADLSGASVVNFIAFNPFEDQRTPGKRTDSNVPRYTDVRAALTVALDHLDAAGIEANVRYFPFCMLPERHWKSNYNFKQLPYDHHEWDYASWTWTAQREQRTSEGDTSPPPVLGPMLRLGPLAGLAQRIAGHGRLRPLLRQIRVRLSSALMPFHSKASIYANNAELRAQGDCGSKYNRACGICSLRGICDGFHGDYAEMFGTDEAATVSLGRQIDDGTLYISRQKKIVEPEDLSWGL